MTDLPFALVNFPVGATYPSSPLKISWLNLVWGAVTVGTTPLVAGGTQRPFLEMVWRASVVVANLRRTPDGWVKSAAYARLDPSEKSAVSYFLGMTQAKVTSELILNVPHLVHLDAILVQKGVPMSGSRPDFVGMNANGTLAPLVLEAKGRTHSWTADLAKTAKTQAQSIPAVLALSPALSVASIAFFEGGIWRARLEDPPVQHRKEILMSPGEFAHLYYLPIARALLDAQKYTGSTTEEVSPNAVLTEGDGSRVEVGLPGADMWVSLPSRILALVQDSENGVLSAEEAGGAIIGYLREARDFQGDAIADAEKDAESPDRYIGKDCVGVRVGPSWLRQDG